MAKANINRIKVEIHKSIIITEDIETSFSIVDKTKIPRKKKENGRSKQHNLHT